MSVMRRDLLASHTIPRGPPPAPSRPDPPRHEDAIRRALPAVKKLLPCPDGDEALELLLTVADVASASATSRAALALLGDPRARVTVVPREGWRRTTEGDVDRRRPLVG